MTNQTIVPTDDQTSPVSTAPIKKTFFGGELAFDDDTVLKAVDVPQTQDSFPVENVDEKNEEQELGSVEANEPKQEETVTIEDIPSEGPEETVEEKTEEKAETKANEDAFDPFGMDEQEIKLPGTPTQEQQELETLEDDASQSPIIEKFLSLVQTAKTIFSLQEDQHSFTLLGEKTATSTLEYYVYLVEDEENHLDLFVKKINIDNKSSDEEEHLLQWSYHTQLQTLHIFVDEILLYQGETPDDDRIILEKLNKFGFLFDSFYTDLNKAHLEKEEMENKKKQLHEIFRNF